jgi:hypothetical protein
MEGSLEGAITLVVGSYNSAVVGMLKLSVTVLPSALVLGDT